MLNPLIHFFNWLETIKNGSVKNEVSIYILRFLAGAPIDGAQRNYQSTKKLKNACRQITNAYKIEGTCILIHYLVTYLLGYYFYCYKPVSKDSKKTRQDLLHKRWKELRAEWELFAADKFNHRYFDEYTFWITEESACGEPNTRIKTLWEEA